MARSFFLGMSNSRRALIEGEKKIMRGPNEGRERARAVRAQMPEPVPEPQHTPIEEPPGQDRPPVVDEPPPGKEAPEIPIPDRLDMGCSPSPRNEARVHGARASLSSYCF